MRYLSLLSLTLLLSGDAFPIALSKRDTQGQEGTFQQELDSVLLAMVLISSIGGFLVFVSLLLWCVVRRRLRLSEDELIREEENQAYLELNSDEQELYFQSKDYLSQNPFLRGEMTLSQSLAIQEKGVAAYEFQKDPMLTNNDLMILNKYELNFFKKFECCSITNLPMNNKNEVYYFESKIYSLPDPENTLISFGLGIKPYPWFRLPGRHVHSISYDSTGYRRHNQPFKFSYEPPFPKCIEGDVIGIGYRTRSGTVFFTRNGKKVNEFKVGGHVKNFRPGITGQLYPIIGANNLCSVHVNLGQAGFVFIEGNVKKWGYAPREGTGPAPPAYNKFNSDILLERSEIDEDELSEREDDFPPDFWEIHNGAEAKGDKYSYNAYSEVDSVDERISLNSILPQRPPSYDENGDEVQEGSPGDLDEDAILESSSVLRDQPLPEHDHDQESEGLVEGLEGEEPRLAEDATYHNETGARDSDA
ncbi:SPRY-domain-containing protein [Suhomyces tanzawaensis NRRL Y-17324]|uniref:SPRY-domain-containing protein n=1 Tax=Suhomyces tanzawaensis NRRL Y-17324 TaxID=984487 RepID=A0A1E4SFW1_9ASCO|nr:SPRY-domain-containing protein [Suhomyces tanzawaensis NRRL Y-17324]ODV78403.1 SPRY-domain-containing protein [Suhomyces tanzawaensis NRRL Y-17324]